MAESRTRELELLAPARNKDIGIAAISCGADAVYIAGPMFGARQAAGNSMEDIAELCRYAHTFGARVFITLNTILYDDEIDTAARQMEEARQAGADALIVQDLAVLPTARQLQKASGFSLPLHASTQCAIRTPEQAKLYEDLGFSRLILERELSLEQIYAIRQATGCELEFFVHGALCVCYSGQCYMSEAITGRSANRGQCAQACRSLYDLVDGTGKVLARDKALLSLKDFNLKDRIADLAQAGITSFKIEGRLKNISYVRNTVRAYSSALDQLASTDSINAASRFRRASFGTVTGGFTPALDKTFNRGYTQLFIDGKRGRWSTYDSAKGMGEEIGTVCWMSPDRTAFRISPSSRNTSPEGKSLKLNNGDGFSFVARNSEVTGFRADKCEGMDIRCKPVPGLFIGARIFRNIDVAFEKELENDLPAREIGVSLEILITRHQDGFKVTADATSEDGRKVSGIFEAGPQSADNRERMFSMFMNQLSKTAGHYRFSVSSIHGEKPDAFLIPFMSAAALNNIRREIASGLDRLPVLARPLMKKDIPDLSLHSMMPLEGKAVSYKANVSNHLAGQVYSDLGAGSVEKAFEITHTGKAELMRMKYCIRYELGLCLKEHGQADVHRELYLLNNGRRFPLLFDCAKCEMAVLPNTPVSRK